MTEAINVRRWAGRAVVTDYITGVQYLSYGLNIGHLSNGAPQLSIIITDGK